MEEAYTELYQQFLRLRSLCLKQATMLHQLTTALQKQQGATFSNGLSGELMSIPVQCTQEIPVFFRETPHPLWATAHNAAAQPVPDGFFGNGGSLADLLAEDVSRLHMDFPQQRGQFGKLDQRIEPPSALDAFRCQGAFSKASNGAASADHPGRDRTQKSATVPASDGAASRGTDPLGQPGGLLMSDVALQSHVCDFCQAVFPGDSTTKGEFLRHLHTHIT